MLERLCNLRANKLQFQETPGLLTVDSCSGALFWILKAVCFLSQVPKAKQTYPLNPFNFLPVLPPTLHSSVGSFHLWLSPTFYLGATYSLYADERWKKCIFLLIFHFLCLGPPGWAVGLWNMWYQMGMMCMCARRCSWLVWPESVAQRTIRARAFNDEALALSSPYSPPRRPPPSQTFFPRGNLNKINW